MPATNKKKVCCVFPEKLEIIKHDVVFFHFIALISPKLPAIEVSFLRIMRIEAKHQIYAIRKKSKIRPRCVLPENDRVLAS